MCLQPAAFSPPGAIFRPDNHLRAPRSDKESPMYVTPGDLYFLLLTGGLALAVAGVVLTGAGEGTTTTAGRMKLVAGFLAFAVGMGTIIAPMFGVVHDLYSRLR